MRITVLGGGHGSYATAADLADQGHAVWLWRRDGAALAAAGFKGGITLRDHRGTREVRLAGITPDLGRAVVEAELIIIPLPAFAQAELARRLAPHLRDGQVIFLPPGTFGSYVMADELRRAGCRARLAFAETGTLPYLARKHEAAEVAITTRATRLPTGVFPANQSERVLAMLRTVYPAIEPLEDALSGALMNAGPIIHPPLILMNAGPLEHFETWDIHNEGTQPSIRRVTDVLDGERIALREALGYGAPHFPLADHYHSDRWMYGNAHDKLVDSGDWRETVDFFTHRYMREDVAMGLVFLVSLADWLKVPCPVAKGLLAMASAIIDEDLRHGSRAWDSLGLDRLDRAGLGRMLHEGLSP